MKTKMLLTIMIPVLAVLIVTGSCATTPKPVGVRGESATIRVGFKLMFNMIVTEVRINGVSKNFILDTGATNTLITEDLAEELGLEKSNKTKAQGFGSEFEISRVLIDSFAIDGIVFTHFTCAVGSLHGIYDTIGRDISGVLGFKINENIYHILCYADIAEFDSARRDFDYIRKNIQFLE